MKMTGRFLGVAAGAIVALLLAGCSGTSSEEGAGGDTYQCDPEAPTLHIAFAGETDEERLESLDLFNVDYVSEFDIDWSDYQTDGKSKGTYMLDEYPSQEKQDEFRDRLFDEAGFFGDFVEDVQFLAPC